MRERDVEKYLRERVKALGGLALKFVSPGCIGVPDRLLLLPGGRAVFAELKAPGEKPTPRQRYIHELLQDLGFMVFVPDCKAAVDEMIFILREGGEL